MTCITLLLFYCFTAISNNTLRWYAKRTMKLKMVKIMENKYLSKTQHLRYD